ncbi:hypothetical protein BCR36DRAFT_583786 [Piromyces finnis]|uniref:Uncharacterized protein n=1 Tax=Piromyces finnis TaxID=1754191 RepID=A0A1Y1V8J8_9FUNG|nr:hypothetical protein BCR36DRAFT_583786 [Piromyces finnis]|eukprot:ORX49731.1 hypothetical protein BCR36DRAFT_583786 [Piromyces finnis]
MFLGVPKLKRRLSINTLTETVNDQVLQCDNLRKKLYQVKKQLNEIHEKVLSEKKQQNDFEVLYKEAQDLIEKTDKRIKENYNMVKQSVELDAKLEANGRDVVSIENKKLNDKIECSKEEFRKFRIEFHDNLKQIKIKLAKYEYYYGYKTEEA